MATLELNGKSLATQTSSAEPVIASTVTGAPALALTNATGTMPTGTQDNITRLGTVTVGNLANTAIVYPAGHILQVTAMGHDYTQRTVSSQTLADWPNMTCSLTPKSTSSKIIIMGMCHSFHESGQVSNILLLRDDGGGYDPIMGGGDYIRALNTTMGDLRPIFWIDSPTIPSTPVLVSYKLQYRSDEGGTTYVNLTTVASPAIIDAESSNSTIFAMEVAG